MDLMGTAEQLGVDAAVTWLGTQAWSNGRVAMIGKSYDGSTPWQAAMFGNPHLSTIVPISGLIGVAELMWKNGSSEARAPIMHNGVYGSYGIDGDAEDLQNLCPDYLSGPATGGAAWAWGGEAAGSYWEERYFLDRVLGIMRAPSTSSKGCTTGTWTRTWPSLSSTNSRTQASMPVASSASGITTTPTVPM